MEKVYITVDEAAQRLSQGLGKSVDRETIAQAFDFAPFGRVPFPLYSRLGERHAEAGLGIEVWEDVWTDEDGEQSPRLRLACYWRDHHYLGSAWAIDPFFDGCSIELLETLGTPHSRVAPVRVSICGYFAVADGEASLIRGQWPSRVHILPPEIYRRDRMAHGVTVEAETMKAGGDEFLFCAADIDSYIGTQRGALPVMGEESDFPEELRLALAAFQAVRAKPELTASTKPKQAMIKWLQANSILSGDACKRVATVANWEKRGGAAKTPTGREPTGG